MSRTKPRKRHTPRANYSAEELRDHEVADLRVDYATTIRDIKSAKSVTAQDGLVYHARETAHRVATRLGHTPLRQGAFVECSMCGRSGNVGPLLDGSVFAIPCGSDFYFGTEKTPEACAWRARWERSRMHEVTIVAAVGFESVVAAHEHAAKAYEARCQQLIDAIQVRTKLYDQAIEGLKTKIERLATRPEDKRDADTIAALATYSEMLAVLHTAMHTHPTAVDPRLMIKPEPTP